MADRLDAAAVEALISRFDDDLGRVEQVPGPTVRAALDAITSLTALYGEALARVVDAADGELVRRLADDELVGHLMSLHGLHPDPVEDRVRRALAELDPRLGANGHAELAGIDEQGVARIRVSAKGCGSAGAAEAVADAVLGEAPELTGVVPEVVQPPTVISVGSLTRRPEGAR
jgi:hypothetical protein